MTIWLDGEHWSHYFVEVFNPQVNIFCDTIIKRILPTFDNIAQEADEIVETEYNRLGDLPADESSGWDMADAADRAFEAGFSHWEALSGVHQAMINLAAVALYHMFEQQLLRFHRRQVLHLSESRDTNKIKMGELIKRLQEGGISLHSLSVWPIIEELQLVANAVKHAEGRSVEELRAVRPDLFYPPIAKGQPSLLPSLKMVYLPLVGRDIYLSVADIEKYRAAVISFWQEFGDVIKEHSRKQTK